MPLINSTSKKALGENIAKERHAGKPEKQAVAIAFRKKREVAKKMRPIHVIGRGHGLAKTAESEYSKHYDVKSHSWID